MMPATPPVAVVTVGAPESVSAPAGKMTMKPVPETMPGLSAAAMSPISWPSPMVRLASAMRVIADVPVPRRSKTKSAVMRKVSSGSGASSMTNSISMFSAATRRNGPLGSVSSRTLAWMAALLPKLAHVTT